MLKEHMSGTRLLSKSPGFRSNDSPEIPRCCNTVLGHTSICPVVQLSLPSVVIYPAIGRPEYLVVYVVLPGR